MKLQGDVRKAEYRHLSEFRDTFLVFPSGKRQQSIL